MLLAEMSHLLYSAWNSLIEYETPRLVKIHNRKVGIVRDGQGGGVGEGGGGGGRGGASVRERMYEAAPPAPSVCDYARVSMFYSLEDEQRW